MIELISPRIRLQLFALLTKHGIKVLHSEQGKIAASIATWREYESEISQLVAELREDPYVYNIQFSDGIVEIEYDEAVLSDRRAIEKWFEILNRYPF